MQPTNIIADTICRTVELGVTITGAAITDETTFIDCTPIATTDTCPGCGEPGRLRDHTERVLTDLPISGHPTRLRVQVPRFTCENPGCGGSIFRGGIDHVASARAKVTARCPRWIIQRLAVDKMSISAIARTLGLDWKTVNTLALAAVRRIVCDDPTRLDTVRYIGVDEHKVRHEALLFRMEVKDLDRPVVVVAG